VWLVGERRGTYGCGEVALPWTTSGELGLDILWGQLEPLWFGSAWCWSLL
jgi:hypothetical protein